jgi:tetratricopeptide (TPR) repeat protein
VVADTGASTRAELARLEAERDDLLALLARVRAELANGEVDETDAASLEDDATARAAEVLRRIEELRAAGAPVRGPTATGGAPRGRWPWIVGVAAFVLVAGFLVYQAAGQRGTGDTFTGDTRQSTRDLLLDARQQLGAGDMEAAIASYDRVLVLAPSNAEALTYRAWVGRTMARSMDDDEALALLADAIASEPGYADARVFRAIILRDQGRFDEAGVELDGVAADDIPAFMSGQVESLRAELADPDRRDVAGAGRLAEDGDITGALRLLDGVLARDPSNVQALVAKATVLAQVATATTGEDRTVLTDNALELLIRANRLVPEDPVPLLYRAQLLVALGRVAEARTVLDQVDALAPLPAELANEVASLRTRLGS